MTLALYQIDAFVTDKPFSGNPAGVCLLNKWLKDEAMQNIAMENNLAETAFIVPTDTHYEIRWFTPTVEVDLCGHATLAAAFVLFNYEDYTNSELKFYSHRSGELKVKKDKDFLTLNFPIDEIEQLDLFKIDGLNIQPKEVWRGKTDFILVFNSEEEILSLNPNYSKLNLLDARGIIVTSVGVNTDFVSRFFAPQSGIDEDPVTGSAHTSLAPYWAKQLEKIELSALQLSKRRGFLHCKLQDNRVEIKGKAHLYLKGEIYI